MTRRACPGLDPGASEASRESSCKSVLKRRMSAFAVFWQDYSPLCGSPFGSCAKRVFASAFGLRDPDRRFAPSGMTILDYFSVALLIRRENSSNSWERARSREFNSRDCEDREQARSHALHDPT